MIDHLSTYATDYEATRNFYQAVFSPLGHRLQMEFTEPGGQRMCAFGPEGNPAFWVIEVNEAASPRHIAFCADSREEVRAFHQAGLEHGSDPEAMAALAGVVAGETKLRFQARKAHDIQTAQRLCSEFGIQGHVLEYGQEAFRCLNVLAAQKTPVVFGPIFVNATGITRSGDSTRPCLGTVTQLRDAGVPYVLTACDLTGEEGLARQAGRAMRLGLTSDETLRAVTSGPAELIGVQDQVGRLERGLHADLVVWNGTPFADTSKVVLTLIDGKPVHDPDDLFAE